MIVTEFYMTRRDGVKLYRSYSDEGFYIERDGEMYEEAIDPEGVNRTYTETDELIPVEELSAEEALAIITGGEV
ncbi:MAG: hypothetical protein O0V67_05835 [Methanocorpusculum sp.]|nr:hypothetical protein [Methanocorpusculum sp.]